MQYTMSVYDHDGKCKVCGEDIRQPHDDGCEVGALRMELKIQKQGFEEWLKSNPIKLVKYGTPEKKLQWAADHLEWEVWSMGKYERKPIWHYRGESLREALLELVK